MNNIFQAQILYPVPVQICLLLCGAVAVVLSRPGNDIVDFETDNMEVEQEVRSVSLFFLVEKILDKFSETKFVVHFFSIFFLSEFKNIF